MFYIQVIWPHTQDQSYPKKKISSGSINSGIQSVQGRSQWYIYLYLIKHQHICKWYTRKLVNLEIMYQLKQLDLQYVFNNRKFTMMCITSIWCGDFKIFLSTSAIYVDMSLSLLLSWWGGYMTLTGNKTCSPATPPKV